MTAAATKHPAARTRAAVAGEAQAESAATRVGPTVPPMPYVATSQPWARRWCRWPWPAMAGRRLLMPPVSNGPNRPETISRAALTAGWVWG